MTVYHGTVLTVNQNDDVFSYLVEDGGKILYVGDSLPTEFADAPVVELEGQALAPAFADTHLHLASYALFHGGLNVLDAPSNREMLRLISLHAKACKDPVVIAFGASACGVEEQRLITREELDQACPEKPLFLVQYDGHACIVNSALLKKINRRVRYRRGYHPDTGLMDKEAFFQVSDYVAHTVKLPVLVRRMQKAVDDLATKGFGLVHSVSGLGFPGDLDISLETWFARTLQNGFQVRVFPQSMHLKAATSRKLPRIGGCFRCALDGCYASQDAALQDSYANNPDNAGILYFSDELVTEFCRQANRAGLQIELHAMGDRAFHQAVKALTAALDDHPRKGHRHGIIHACLPSEADMDLCREYKIQLPMQIVFDNRRQEPPAYLRELLGDRRMARLNPVASFLRRGCDVSFGSDAPTTEPDPILWLYKAVNHSNPKEALTIQEALRCATYNGYRASFDDRQRGSFKKGKIADMVILSENPYEIPGDQLLRLKVNRLILGGKPYRNQTKKCNQVILQGIFSKNRA